MDYLMPPAENEGLRCFSLCIYTSLHIMAVALNGHGAFGYDTTSQLMVLGLAEPTSSLILRTLNQLGLWSSMISYRKNTD